MIVCDRCGLSTTDRVVLINADERHEIDVCKECYSELLAYLEDFRTFSKKSGDHVRQTGKKR